MKLFEFRPLMLWYSAIFILLTISFEAYNYLNNFGILFLVISVAVSILANTGNLFYAFKYENKTIKKYWRPLFYVMIVNFIIWNIYKSYCCVVTMDTSFLILSIAWSFTIAIYLPTFVSNYKVAFN